MLNTSSSLANDLNKCHRTSEAAEGLRLRLSPLVTASDTLLMLSALQDRVSVQADTILYRTRTHSFTLTKTD